MALHFYILIIGTGLLCILLALKGQEQDTPSKPKAPQPGSRARSSRGFVTGRAVSESHLSGRTPLRGDAPGSPTSKHRSPDRAAAGSLASDYSTSGHHAIKSRSRQLAGTQNLEDTVIPSQPMESSDVKTEISTKTAHQRNHYRKAPTRSPMTWDQVAPELQSFLNDRIEALSTLPTALNNLITALQDPDTSPKDIAKIASTDPAVATEILRELNSAFYSLREKISDLSRAILMLGYNKVKFIVLRSAMSRTFNIFSQPEFTRKLTAIWRHSFLVSEAVTLLLRNYIHLLHLEASTPALLHDLGKLLLIDLKAKDDFDPESVFQLGAIHMEERVFIEEDYYGINHCLIGSLIASKLELPTIVTDVLSYHHHGLDSPQIASLPDGTVRIIALVKLGDDLVHNFTSGQQAKEEGLPIPSPPRPEMSIYRNYFPNLPPYQQLLDSSQPTLLKAALFLDSIFPRKGLANTPVRITSKWAAARKGAALEVTSSGSPVGPAKGTACSTHDVSPCGFKSRQIVADRYVLLHQIGRDGIGSVYLCEDLFLGQKFAIKILHSKFKQSKPELQSLLNETRIVTKLSHPNIARVFHFYIRDGVCFNLQEYIKGRNLGEVLEDKPGGKLPEKDVLDIASSLVEALRYAHGEGVIHRDLNADNILLDENGVVKLLDFGMAACKITSSETEPGSFTKFSSTPYYMSPEHWEDLELVDHRSDIYSLGVLLYKLLSGSYPFQGYSIEALRKAQLTKRPGMIPDISERMMSLILRCLEPSPSKRWQDIPTVAYRLEQTKDTAARAGFTR